MLDFKEQNMQLPVVFTIKQPLVSKLVKSPGGLHLAMTQLLS